MSKKKISGGLSLSDQEGLNRLFTESLQSGDVGKIKHVLLSMREISVDKLMEMVASNNRKIWEVFATLVVVAKSPINACFVRAFDEQSDVTDLGRAFLLTLAINQPSLVHDYLVRFVERSDEESWRYFRDKAIAAKLSIFLNTYMVCLSDPVKDSRSLTRLTEIDPKPLKDCSERVIYVAAEHADFKLLELCLKNKCNVNGVNESRVTPLTVVVNHAVDKKELTFDPKYEVVFKYLLVDSTARGDFSLPEFEAILRHFGNCKEICDRVAKIFAESSSVFATETYRKIIADVPSTEFPQSYVVIAKDIQGIVAAAERGEQMVVVTHGLKDGQESKHSSSSDSEQDYVYPCGITFDML